MSDISEEFMSDYEEENDENNDYLEELKEISIGDIPISGAKGLVDIACVTDTSICDTETYIDTLSNENVESASFLPIDQKMYYASRSFMRHEGPVATHINSYNYAMCYLIPQIIDTKGTVTVEHEGLIHRTSLSSAYFGKPKHKENDESVILLNPKLCLDRKISYFAPLYVNVTYYNPAGAVVKKKKMIGEVPVMVLSTLCNLTPIKNDEQAMADLHEDIREVGGYFIVKGQQKVVIHQVAASHNQICTYKGKNNSKGGPKFAVYAETRSGSSSSHSTTARAGILEKSKLLACTVQYIDQPVPVCIIFRALGVKTEREIANYIFPAEWYINPPSLEHKTMIEIIIRSLEQSYNYNTQEEALHFIGKSGQKYTSSKNEGNEFEEVNDTIKASKNANSRASAISYAKHLLSNELLPHIGLGEDYNTIKCFFIGYMIQRALLAYVGLIPITDRDHFMNKRLQTSGLIIATQFFNVFRQLMKHIEDSMKRNLAHNIPIVASSYIAMPYIITSSLTSALTSNKWNSKGQNQGISQTIDAFNYCALLSCLRKFIIPLNADAGKIEKPRHLHGSQWGVACMYKTPEGKQVGLVLGFAMGAYISVGTDPEPVIEILKEMDIVPMKEISTKGSISDFLRYTKIFVNGNPQGYTHYPEEVTNQLRRLRQSASIDMEVSILYDKVDNCIFISTEAGRFGRAVALAPNGELKLTESVLDEIKLDKWDTFESNAWIKLTERGLTEILFKDEEEEMNVAIFPSDLVKMSPYLRIKYTHCELTPDMIEGAGVSTSPHNDHNQAPRNIYQESMSHQAVANTSNIQFQRKGKWHALKYPQKPLVSTRISRELGFDHMPMGQNVTICVMPWKGRGQEDSILLHKQAVDRGLFCTITYLAYESTLSHPQTSNSSRYESFEIPDPARCNDFNGNASKLVLHEDGGVYIPVGTVVNKEDILIGVVVTGTIDNPMFNKQKNKINISQKYDHKLPGVVHSVQTGYDGKGFKYIRLVVAQERKPMLGDKFCYTPDHEVLTTDGWVNIADIRKWHLVASLKDGRELVYEHPTEVMSFPLEKGEKVIRVSTNQVELCVTANHNMYVKLENSDNFTKKEAKELFDTHVRYKKNVELTNFSIKNSDITGIDIPQQMIESWLMFYGIWLNQKYWSKDNDMFAVNKYSVSSDATNLLDELDFRYEKRDASLIITDVHLNLYLNELSQSKMEEWVWKLPQSECRILLNSITKYKNAHKNTVFYHTFSKFLKDDIMRLALHSGWAANAVCPLVQFDENIHKSKNPSSSVCSWLITIIKDNLEPLVNQQTWEEPEHDKVFCCTMPSGLLYVRNSSGDLQRPVWCGNSASHGQKGTAGSILDTKEMPFLKKRGWTPDLIINPLAFPSRMTIGMLLEMMMGTALTSTALQTDDFDKPLCLDDPDQVECITSMIKKWKYPEGFDPSTDYEQLDNDASPWNKSFSIDYFFDALKRLGINEYSDEIVINPETGTELVYPIFSTIVFYQRLKHMSVDKTHARARGPRHGLHKQPTEGRKKGGGFRVGHMERDKIAGNSRISLREGISVSMRDLTKFEKVWGWNDIERGLEKSEQIGFHKYEEKSRIYIMTLQDGRIIKCGKNHPFYTESDMKYSDIEHIRPGADRVACAISRPSVKFTKDQKACKDFIWNEEFFAKIHKDEKTFSDEEILRKSLCLARLVGLAITDGHAAENNNSMQVYTGHELDVETIKDDIFRLTGITVFHKFEDHQEKGSAYVINLPLELSKKIRDMGIIKGGKVTKECFFPDFIHTNTPLPILREFLGGLFGGDGHTLCLSQHRDKRDLMKAVAFSWTRNKDNLESLKATFSLLGNLLSRFGIESQTQAPKLTTNSKQSGGARNHYEIVHAIKLSSVITFAEKIGFRYCEHKSLRLDAGVSYLRFRDGVMRQRQWICDRASELSDYKTKKENGEKQVFISKYIEKATEELELMEPILHKEAIPTTKMAGRIILARNNNVIRSTTFPTIEDYLKDIGAIDLFLGEENGPNYAIKRGQNYLPNYWLKVLRIERTKKKMIMYDIQIAETESYVANGVVSHNCMLGQGAPHMVNDRLFHQSDAHQIHVCSICGIQATSVAGSNIVQCRICGSNECVLVDIPYGTKLMGDEFQVMNFVPRIITLPSSSTNS